LEFTGYLDIAGYKRAVERLGYRTNYRDNHVPQFTFAADGTRVEYEDYPDAYSIWPGGKGSNYSGYGASANPHFIYDEAAQLYYRYEFGQDQIDELNGDHLSFSNVVLQFANGRRLDDHDYLAFDVHSSGEKALVFTNGKMIEGTWERSVEDIYGNAVPAKFYDLEGNEIVFNQVKTWICLIWNDYADVVVVE
jgi:hypothetical protein